ncbi:hypothetical protein BT96DRAFT_115411 [Gymnopus androsaceus JB14]|uniref:Uncharacterized protein n=1 Tax=Gymnopus androsaceus JB14 TaxID=1447944 RepID=A0A6A4HDE1_9AGAR|nr:hypothetical protein BT96DRAFT_115411 [Gymnopus androsaceus JB14]
MSLNSNKEQSYYISRRRQLQPVAPSPLETYNPHSKLWFRSSPMFQSKHRPLLTKELAIPSRIDEVSCWRNTTLSRHAEVRFIILKISSSPPNAFNSLDVQAYNAQRRNESVQILNHAISVIDELAVMLSAGERHDFDLSSSEELVLCRRVTKDCWYTSLRDTVAQNLTTQFRMLSSGWETIQPILFTLFRGLSTVGSFVQPFFMFLLVLYAILLNQEIERRELELRRIRQWSRF